MINRSLQPEIQDLDNLTVPLPRRTTLSNGIPLAIIAIQVVVILSMMM